MEKVKPAVLTLSRAFLRLLVLLNLTLGLLILAMLVISFADGPLLLTALRARPGADAAFVRGMRLIMVIGIAAVPLTHVLLTRLGAIVETVRAGDPFIARNAARLRTIAWVLLALELLHLAAGAVAAAASSPADPLDIDWNVSVAGWLAVLLLFVLARVFEEGARMRDELEGTV